VSLPVVWIPEAAAELEEAANHYAEIRPELALRFALAVDEAVESLADAPTLFAIVKKRLRRAGVKRFPYGLFFLVEQNRVVIVACFHGKRNPKHWQGRTF